MVVAMADLTFHLRSGMKWSDGAPRDATFAYPSTTH
jgi:ABC-type transport system substrate-binding protein